MVLSHNPSQMQMPSIIFGELLNLRKQWITSERTRLCSLKWTPQIESQRGIRFHSISSPWVGFWGSVVAADTGPSLLRGYRCYGISDIHLMAHMTITQSNRGSYTFPATVRKCEITMFLLPLQGKVPLAPNEKPNMCAAVFLSTFSRHERIKQSNWATKHEFGSLSKRGLRTKKLSIILGGGGLAGRHVVEWCCCGKGQKDTLSSRCLTENWPTSTLN